MIDVLNKEYDMAISILSGASLAPNNSQQSFTVKDIVNNDVVVPIVNVSGYLKDPEVFVKYEFNKEGSYLKLLK